MAHFPSQLQDTARLRLLSPCATLLTMNPHFQRAGKGLNGFPG